MSYDFPLILLVACWTAMFWVNTRRLTRIEKRLAAIEDALFADPDDDDPAENDQAPAPTKITAIGRKAA